MAKLDYVFEKNIYVIWNLYCYFLDLNYIIYNYLLVNLIQVTFKEIVDIKLKCIRCSQVITSNSKLSQQHINNYLKIKVCGRESQCVLSGAWIRVEMYQKYYT